METDSASVQQPPVRRSKLRAWATVGLLAALGYLLVAYVILPFAWGRYETRHPALDDVPGLTETGSHIPADPLNVALVGSKAELVKIMLAAKWHPADALSLKSCLEIAEAVMLKRPYADAPVSSLYLFGRKEDLAFEQPVGDNPSQRHHVRFWRAAKNDAAGRELWIGGAVFDERVGLSRTTGEITHVTAPDVDVERDYLFQCLEKTGSLASRYSVDDFHKIRQGKNGGGDPWRTDGKLYVGVLAVEKVR